jgi:hypothetical protein
MAVSRLNRVRLPRKDQEVLNQICTELRKSCASETDIVKARLSLKKALFVNSRMKTVNTILRVIVSQIVMIPILVLLAMMEYNQVFGTKLTTGISGGDKFFYITVFWIFLLTIVMTGKTLFLNLLDVQPVLSNRKFQLIPDFNSALEKVE